MGSNIQVYDAKVSIRTKLKLLRTIRSQLISKPERYEKFKRTVFGPWLDIRTKEHDNHLINCLLQHQRYIKDPQTCTPFIFDIGQHSLEFGRREFCLVTGFRFGDSSLAHLRMGNSLFSERVFPGLSNGVHGSDVSKLFNTQSDFNKLSDDDAVRLCLLLALEFMFIGHELKHVIPKEILVLVDDLKAWDDFPWGEYIWTELHKRVYNHDHKNRETHLDKIAAFGPSYLQKYTVQGFVFPFKIWLLETFPNSKEWWGKEENVIPRSVAWFDKVPFYKTQYNSLFNVRTIVSTLNPSSAEMNTHWWKSSLLYFHNIKPASTSPQSNSKKRKPHSNSKVVSNVEVKNSMHEVDKEIPSKNIDAVHEANDEENVAGSNSMLQGDQHIISDCTDVVHEAVDNVEVKNSMHEVDKEIPSKNIDAVHEGFDNEDDEHPNLDNISISDINFTDEELLPVESQNEPMMVGATDQGASNSHGKSVCTDSQSQDVKVDVNTAVAVAPLRQLSQRETKDSRYRKDPYTIQPDSTTRKERVCAKIVKRQSQYIHPLVGPDGEVIPPWTEDLSRAKHSSTRCVTVPKEVLSLVRQPEEHYFSFPWARDGTFVYNQFWSSLLGFGKERDGWLSDTHLDLWVLFLWNFRPSEADWAIAGPFFSTFIRQGQIKSAMCYADGVTYGVPWFAESIEKVYFPINVEDVHWVLACLELRTGIITFYDSLPPKNGVEFRPWWLNTRACFQVELLKLLIQTEVMTKKNIDPTTYRITYRYDLNVPRQGPGDCGIWVMRNMYRLVNNLPLEVDNPIQAGLAYREHLCEFFWKYKIFTGKVDPSNGLIKCNNVC